VLSEVGVAQEKVEVERERRQIDHAKVLLAASQHQIAGNGAKAD
jgi:hypothetical protein